MDVQKLDDEIREKMLFEVRTYISSIKSLKDNNIVRYIDVTLPEEDEINSIAVSMEYVSGGSISSLLKFFTCFKEPLVKIYVNQIVKALYRLHKRGLIHGDLKPSNLLVDGLGTIVLSDFGTLKRMYVKY